jgi:hypothetical protein
MMNSLRQGLSVVAVAGWIMLTGCAGNGAIPTNLEKLLGANGTADDHIAAAMLYQQKAEQLAGDAAQFEQQRKNIGLHEDLKGFRRAALRTAAQTRRQEAAEMEQLYAAHVGKAQTMMGKQQPAVSHFP